MLWQGACQNTLHRASGRAVFSYTLQHILPSMLQEGDLLMACTTGLALSTPLLSFERVQASPDKVAVLTLLSAGMCAQEAAWEAELRGLRAIYTASAAEAQDARIQEKTAHHLAAQRFYQAFQHLHRAFGKIENPCPALQQAHRENRQGEDADGMVFLLGISSGVLATLHDRASEGAASVPADSALEAARAASCLNDQRWWGVPTALRMAVGLSIPGALPPNTVSSYVWQQLNQAAAQGDAQGVRLARAFLVQASAAQGRLDRLKTAIATQAHQIQSHPPDPAWRMLDSYGTRLILHESDKLWTQATGHRTPFGSFGSFWDESPLLPVNDPFFDGVPLKEPTL